MSFDNGRCQRQIFDTNMEAMCIIMWWVFVFLFFTYQLLFSGEELNRECASFCDRFSVEDSIKRVFGGVFYSLYLHPNKIVHI